MIWSLKGKAGGGGTKGSSREPWSCQSGAVQHGPGKESLPHYQQMSLPKDVARQRSGRCPPSLSPPGHTEAESELEWRHKVSCPTLSPAPYSARM